jgi:hypothetical protein
VPVATINDPTRTSLIVALAPDWEKPVSTFTTIVATSPVGPVTVMVSPLIALTRPPMAAGTIVIDAATLESEELGTTRTFSPSDKLSDLAPGRRSVTVVEALIEYVDEPDNEVTVIDEPESAVRSPRGPRDGIGAGADTPASFGPRAAGGLTGLDGCVDALATPMPLASTVTAIAEESPTFWRARLRDVYCTGNHFLSRTGEFRDRNIFANECVDAIGLT